MKKNIELFKVFFKIGAFTFGGGFAMIPLIERELVDNKGWIDGEEIVQLFAVSQSIPGAIAINTSTLVGYKVNKRLGAIFATLGVILPSFFIILFIASFLKSIEEYAIVKAAFKGIGAAVIILICMAAKKIMKTFYRQIGLVGITIGTTALMLFTTISPIFMIIAGGIFGVLMLKEDEETTPVSETRGTKSEIVEEGEKAV